MLVTLANDASGMSAASAAVVPEESHQRLLAGALSSLKSSSSEDQGPRQQVAVIGGRGPEVSSHSNIVSQHRTEQKQRLLSRVWRLRWWTGPRVQAGVALASTCIWVAIPLAIDVLTPASSQPQQQQPVCAVLPLQTWAGAWPAVALLVGGTLAVLFSLRSINESVSLRLELAIVAMACAVGAVVQTVHTAVPQTLSLEAASAVMLGLGVTASLAWPLYLSFSKRFSIANSRIDAEKIANLLASASSGSPTSAASVGPGLLSARSRSGTSVLTLLEGSGGIAAGRRQQDWVVALDQATPGQLLSILSDRRSDFLSAAVSVTHADLLALARLEAAGKAEFAQAEHAASVERFVHPGEPPKPLPRFLHSTSAAIGHLLNTGTLPTAADEEAGLLLGASGRRRGGGASHGSQVSILSSSRSRRRSGQALTSSLSMSPGAAASRHAADSKAGRAASSGLRQAGRDSGSVATLEIATGGAGAGASGGGGGRKSKAAAEPLMLDAPTLPEALGGLQMNICIAHPHAYEQFQLFVESELASENLLFLEAVFLFKLGVVTSMVRAGVCYDVDSASLKPLKDSHRAVLLSDVRALVGHRIFVHGAILTLEWLSQMLQSDEGWRSILETRPRRENGRVEALSYMLFGPAAAAAAAAATDDKPRRADATSTMKPIQEGDPASPTTPRPDGKEPAPLTGIDDLRSGTVRGAAAAAEPSDGGGGSEADRHDRGTSTLTSRLADVTVDEVEALISDGLADISEQFIHRDAVMEINISCRTRTACLSTISSSPLATGPYTFDNVARTVRLTLTRDTFPRFLRSPVVSEWFARRPWEVAAASETGLTDFE
jgi:hypothetical protein